MRGAVQQNFRLDGIVEVSLCEDFSSFTKENE